jgi:glycosyltransferase 2 family protein
MAQGTKSPGLRGWLIRLAGSAVLLGLLFWMLPRGAIVEGLSRVPPLLFLGVFLAFLVAHVAAAAKWWLILGRPCGFLLALRAHFGGLAANLCLPGAVGGDAVRAAMVHGAMRDAPRLAAGAVADRVIDMLALVLLSGVGLLLMRQGEVVNAGLLAKAGAALLVLAGVLGWVLPMLLPRLWDLAPRLPGRSFALQMRDAFGALARRPGLLLAVLVASVLIQGALVMLAYVLALATGVTVAAGPWVFAWPLAKILAILPISLGGLGLREATLAALLVPFGAVAAEVVAAGLAWQGVLFLTGGIGGLIVLLSRSHARQALDAKDLPERILK